MKLRLVPSLDDFKKNNELCPKEILIRIYNRLNRNKLNFPTKPENISDLYEKDRLNGLKRINVSDSEKISYSKFEINKKEYSLRCAYSEKKKRVIFWIECKDTEDLEIRFQLNFNKNNWVDDWFDALLKIQQRIELLTLRK